jgi:hypothetical protein
LKRNKDGTPCEDFLIDEPHKDIDYIEHALFKPIFLNSGFVPEAAEEA